MTTPKKKTTADLAANLRERVLADLEALKVPISAEALDAALARAEQEGLAYLNFLELLVGEPAARRCQRAVEQRIRDAHFRDDRDLADFDWKFNAAAIDRRRSSSWPPASSSAAERTSSWSAKVASENPAQRNTPLVQQECEGRITVTDPCHPLFGKTLKLAGLACLPGICVTPRLKSLRTSMLMFPWPVPTFRPHRERNPPF